MRGTISLDILLSFIVMLIVSSVIIGTAFVQLENAAIASAQYKAESAAMGVGSAINHFYAIRPSEGELRVSPGQIGTRSMSIGMSGWPDVYSVSLSNCTIEFAGDILWMNFTLYRAENNLYEYVNASYPLVDVELASGEPAVNTCDQTIIVSSDMEVSYA